MFKSLSSMLSRFFGATESVLISVDNAARVAELHSQAMLAEAENELIPVLIQAHNTATTHGLSRDKTGRLVFDSASIATAQAALAAKK